MTGHELPRGAYVNIRSRAHWANGYWGIVRMFDGEFYHVALCNGTETLVFTRQELHAPSHPPVDICPPIPIDPHPRKW